MIPTFRCKGAKFLNTAQIFSDICFFLILLGNQQIKPHTNKKSIQKPTATLTPQIYLCWFFWFMGLVKMWLFWWVQYSKLRSNARFVFEASWQEIDIPWEDVVIIVHLIWDLSFALYRWTPSYKINIFFGKFLKKNNPHSEVFCPYFEGMICPQYDCDVTSCGGILIDTRYPAFKLKKNSNVSYFLIFEGKNPNHNKIIDVFVLWYFVCVLRSLWHKET